MSKGAEKRRVAANSTYALQLDDTRTDRSIARWLAAQPDPSEALKDLIAAHLTGKRKVDAELASLRHQVRVLCDVLDRVTGQYAPRPVGMSRQPEPEPIRPITISPPRAEDGRQEAAAASDEGVPSLDRQIDDKIGKLLDFGDI